MSDSTWSFTRDDMTAYARCALMRGIGLDKALAKPGVKDILFRACRMALAEAPGVLTPDAVLVVLTDVLRHEADWLDTDAETLRAAMVRDGFLSDSVDTVTLDAFVEGTRAQLQDVLRDVERRRAAERAAKREALQAKNRQVNAPKGPEVDPVADAAMMREAIQEACEAERRGEVPVGAVLVKDGRILARTGNAVMADHDPTAHAEMLAIREAARVTGNERLTGTTLYVTLEPCPMCACAIAHARIERVVWGADDVKNGAMGGKLDLAQAANLNHRAYVTRGVLKDDCEAQLTAFFARRRQEQQDKKDAA